MFLISATFQPDYSEEKTTNFTSYPQLPVLYLAGGGFEDGAYQPGVGLCR